MATNTVLPVSTTGSGSIYHVIIITRANLNGSSSCSHTVSLHSKVLRVPQTSSCTFYASHEHMDSCS